MTFRAEAVNWGACMGIYELVFPANRRAGHVAGTGGKRNWEMRTVKARTGVPLLEEV